MRSLASKAWRNFARPFMPTVDGEFNEVTVPAFKLGDYKITSEYPVRPGYEEQLVKAVKSFVSEGDSVCVVGGGYGVSSVHSLRQIGVSGELTVFEASRQMLEKCRKVLEACNYDNWTLEQGLFYAAKDVWGDFQGAREMQAEDLPESDVLILDCEGVEKDIIRDLEGKPSTLIVETHDEFDSSRRDVQRLLESQGYRVSAVFLMENPADIVVAERRGETRE